MNAAGPIIKRLDHVIARTNDPQSLFQFFTESLQLPVAWPLKAYPIFTSGGVVLGNTNLEILRVGPPAALSSSASGEQHARLCAIAFEADLAGDTVPELERRRIPHSSVLPYVREDDGGHQVTLWSNVMLGKLLGRSFWIDANIFMSRLPGAAAMADASRGGLMVRWSMDRMFASALVFLVQYAYENFQHFAQDLPHWAEFESHDEKRGHDLEVLRERGGGPTGLESVREIIAGVSKLAEARALWRRFAAPFGETAPGLWPVGDGPAVRLVEAQRNAIKALVLKVKGLERAKTFLREKGMLGVVKQDEITIAPGAVQGLDIRLVQ